MGYISGSDNMKLQLQQWSERPRTLVLMLAVILPAIALIGFGLYHLWSIQRDKAIEAAIPKLGTWPGSMIASGPRQRLQSGRWVEAEGAAHT